MNQARDVLLLLLLSALLAFLAVRNDGPRKRHECERNLREIAAALELYSTDNSGRYPRPWEEQFVTCVGAFQGRRASLVVPRYLPTVPVCPTTGLPYSLQAGVAPDLYTLICSGNHVRTGIRTLQFTSVTALPHENLDAETHGALRTRAVRAFESLATPIWAHPLGRPDQLACSILARFQTSGVDWPHVRDAYGRLWGRLGWRGYEPLSEIAPRPGQYARFLEPVDEPRLQCTLEWNDGLLEVEVGWTGGDGIGWDGMGRQDPADRRCGSATPRIDDPGTAKRPI